MATNDKRKQSLYFPEEMLAPAAMVFRRAVEVAVQEVQSSDDADRSCSASVLLRTCGWLNIQIAVYLWDAQQRPAQRAHHAGRRRR